tara:strand:+ start:1461 stop:1670 length:210 start_codon:yes stop_codon:yes gene_type:complete
MPVNKGKKAISFSKKSICGLIFRYSRSFLLLLSIISILMGILRFLTGSGLFLILAVVLIIIYLYNRFKK